MFGDTNIVIINELSNTLAFFISFILHLRNLSSDNSEKLQSTLSQTTNDTEIVVVIGYSFPFFNRVTDRAIFNGMPNLKKVYVQDINADAVVQAVHAVLPSDRKVNIEPIRNCEQFYLPVEL